MHGATRKKREQVKMVQWRRWVVVVVVAATAACAQWLWSSVSGILELSVHSVRSTHPPGTCSHVKGPRGAEDVVVSGL